MPVLRTMFSGQHYRVVLWSEEGVTPKTVAFSTWTANPLQRSGPFATGLMVELGIPFVGIVPVANCWYQHEEINQALACVKQITGGGPLRSYGSSMAGYATLNFGRYLNISHALVAVPQYSMDPNLASFETRWRADVADLAFRNDFIHEGGLAAEVTIMVDPAHTLDFAHANRIAARCYGLTIRKVGGAGHDVLRKLQTDGVLKDIASNFLLDRLNMQLEALPKF